MGKVKNLLVNLMEYDDEINEVLERIKTSSPATFHLFYSSEICDEAKENLLKKFTNDEELITLIMIKLELEEYND